MMRSVTGDALGASPLRLAADVDDPMFFQFSRKNLKCKCRHFHSHNGLIDPSTSFAVVIEVQKKNESYLQKHTLFSHLRRFSKCRVQSCVRIIEPV
ncbi:hypothetical protein F2P81_004227 [Scophthalmus maximus]|uniref:Uncharacterized protein n=1 Tax=Scophthalmus maximus TaxID=52904 RepID=A0A6A4TGI8_SCOMX|nr:hypothetical protein F2P81_004227 [Scophthalmus maximus]